MYHVTEYQFLLVILVKEKKIEKGDRIEGTSQGDGASGLGLESLLMGLESLLMRLGFLLLGLESLLMRLNFLLMGLESHFLWHQLPE